MEPLDLALGHMRHLDVQGYPQGPAFPKVLLFIKRSFILHLGEEIKKIPPFTSILRSDGRTKWDAGFSVGGPTGRAGSPIILLIGYTFWAPKSPESHGLKRSRGFCVREKCISFSALAGKTWWKTVC